MEPAPQTPPPIVAAVIITGLVLLCPQSTSAISRTPIRCLSNADCPAGGIAYCSAYAVRNCSLGCLSRRYTTPDGALLAHRLDCSRKSAAEGLAEMHYCRDRPDCNDPKLPELPGNEGGGGGARTCLDWDGRSKECSRGGGVEGDSGGGGGGGVGGGAAGGGGDLLLKVLAVVTCLLALTLLGVVGHSFLAGRQRHGESDRRRQRRHQQRLRQQTAAATPVGSPNGSAVTTVTLPRRAVQLLLQFDEHMQQQQQNQHHLFHHCGQPMHLHSPCPTMQSRRQQPLSAQPCSHATWPPAAATETVVSSDQGDGDEDTFV